MKKLFYCFVVSIVLCKIEFVQNTVAVPPNFADNQEFTVLDLKIPLIKNFVII